MVGCGDDLICIDGECKQPTLESFLSPVEDAPLTRRVSWDAAAVPEGYSVKVQCCLPSESEDCTEDEPEEGNDFVDFSFTDLINGEEDKMKSYAQSNYKCGAKLCKAGICQDEPLILATIKCGYGSITITGDPSTDGFFSIGSSGVKENQGVSQFINPGVFVSLTNGEELGIKSIEVFVSSFFFKESLLDKFKCTEDNDCIEAFGNDGATCTTGFCRDYINVPAGDQIPQDDYEVIAIGIDTGTETLSNTVLIKADPVGSSATYPAVGVDSGSWGEESFSTQPTVGGSVQLTYQTGGNLYNYRYVSADGNAPVINAGLISNVRYITTKIDSSKREFIIQVDSLLTGAEGGGTPFSEAFDSGWKFVVAVDTNPAGVADEDSQTNSIAFGLPKACPVV